MTRAELVVALRQRADDEAGYESVFALIDAADMLEVDGRAVNESAVAEWLSRAVAAEQELDALRALIRILLEQEPRPKGAQAYEVTMSHTLWARLTEAAR